MRILHLIPRLISGGAERQLAYLALELKARGHDVHIGYLAGSDTPQRLLNSGIELHPLRFRSTHDPLLFVEIYRLVRRIKPEIIQTWILQMDVLGGLVALLTRTPWLLREPASAKLWAPSMKTSLRLVIAKAACCVVSNSMQGDDYWQRYKSQTKRRVIVNAVPVDEIEAVPAVEREADDAFQRVIFAGRLDPQKNIAVTVEALIKVSKTHAIRAVLMGEGPFEERVRERIESTDSGEFIRLEHYSDRLWSVMKSAAALISISHFEGRPNVVLEAMAAGCPLIVSDIPEHREILDDDACTFVKNFEDIDAVATAIRTVISDPLAAHLKSARARALVSGYTVERLGREYEALYRSVLAGS